MCLGYPDTMTRLVMYLLFRILFLIDRHSVIVTLNVMILQYKSNDKVDYNKSKTVFADKYRW